MSLAGVQRNARVLLIDDNRAIHEDFRKILCSGTVEADELAKAEAALFYDGNHDGNSGRPSFEVDSAYQGQEALEMARNAMRAGRPYAMAFVDMRMPPGWDGTETVTRIWEVQPDLQVVICTAFSDYSWDQLTSKLKHSDQLVILKKPFDTVEVMQLACALTAKWRLQQEAALKVSHLEQLVQERTKVLQTTNVTLENEIVERRRAAEALRESEERYQLLFRKNPLPMWVVDLETLSFLAVNETAVRHYGYSAEEFRKMTIRDVRADENQITVEQHLAEARANAITAFYARHRKKDATIIDVEAVGATITYAGREAKLAVINDVTSRKAAQDRIREQAMLLNLAHDAIYVRDLAGKITFWNCGAETLYGWNAHDAVGKTIAEVFAGTELASPFEAAERELLESGEWSGEVHRLTQDGRKVIINSRWTLLRDEQGSPRSVLVIEADITEKKKLETRFLRAQRMEGIGTLATGMAHDLNNILAPILISAGTLRWDLRPEEKEDAINHIESGVKRGAEIIRQVLTFGRGVEGEHVAVNPAELLKETLTIVSQSFPKDINVTHKTEPNPWPIVGDKTQIHQVLLNLCINARDAMPRGGQLTLTARNVMVDENYPVLHSPGRSGPYVAFEVTDSGCGIATADIERIFDPFFTTKEFGKGTGLGLSTVLGIVKSHHGLIAVESQVNKGTTFRILFPISAEAAKRIIPQSSFPLPRGGGESILIVDDEVSIISTNRKMLEKNGYKVYTAHNGQQALEVFKEHQQVLDLIVTDIMMPGMDGMGFIRAVRMIDSEIRIIASSGLGSGLANNEGGDARAEELRSLNVNAFLAKPYAANRLLIEMNRVLRGGTGETSIRDRDTEVVR